MTHSKEILRFTIPLNPASKKNGSQVFRMGKRVVVRPNKPYLEYEPKAIESIPLDCKVEIDYPVNIQATYYRSSKRRVDITNLESALMDVLVKAKVLKDDSAIPPIAVSTDGSRVLLDREHPRTEVVISERSEQCFKDLINKK